MKKDRLPEETKEILIADTLQPSPSLELDEDTTIHAEDEFIA